MKLMIFFKKILFHNLFFMHLLFSTKTESFFFVMVQIFSKVWKSTNRRKHPPPTISTKLHKRSIADLWLLPFTIKARPPPVTQRKNLSFRGVFLLYYYKKKIPTSFTEISPNTYIKIIFNFYNYRLKFLIYLYIKLERNFARNSFLSGWAW